LFPPSYPYLLLLQLKHICTTPLSLVFQKLRYNFSDEEEEEEADSEHTASTKLQIPKIGFNNNLQTTKPHPRTPFSLSVTKSKQKIKKNLCYKKLSLSKGTSLPSP
jgi:hypothetical protein